jgi:hypothetical protein
MTDGHARLSTGPESSDLPCQRYFFEQPSKSQSSGEAYLKRAGFPNCFSDGAVQLHECSVEDPR